MLLLLPVMQDAAELVNSTVTTVFGPQPLPKLDFRKGIPPEFATMVAVPALLLNEEQVRKLVVDLEVRFLANRDPHLHFALLTDLPDSLSKPHEEMCIRDSPHTLPRVENTMAMEQQEGAASSWGVPGIEFIDELDGKFDKRVSIILVRFA